jgi:hypothetical protein
MLQMIGCANAAGKSHRKALDKHSVLVYNMCWHVVLCATTREMHAATSDSRPELVERANVSALFTSVGEEEKSEEFQKGPEAIHAQICPSSYDLVFASSCSGRSVAR